MRVSWRERGGQGRSWARLNGAQPTFESFCDIYKNEIDFLIEAKQSTKKLMEEESFTDKKWTDLITKIRKVEEEVYYHAETFSYKDWDVDLCIMWHKFWYSIKC